MSDVNWAADVLRKHNLWRRDAGSDGEHEQQSPADIGRAIDIAVASLASRPGWLPIESAPRDGTPVLLCGASSAELVVGEWLKCASPYWLTGLVGDFDAAYTHWQHLPTPPASDMTPTAVRKTTLYKSIAPWLAPKDRKEFARMLGMVPRSSMTYSWCDGFSTRKLFDAFAWVLTPQGADYWDKLNDNLEQAGYYNAN